MGWGPLESVCISTFIHTHFSVPSFSLLFCPLGPQMSEPLWGPWCEYFPCPGYFLHWHRGPLHQLPLTHRLLIFQTLWISPTGCCLLFLLFVPLGFYFLWYCFRGKLMGSTCYFKMGPVLFQRWSKLQVFVDEGYIWPRSTIAVRGKD